MSVLKISKTSWVVISIFVLVFLTLCVVTVVIWMNSREATCEYIAQLIGKPGRASELLVHYLPESRFNFLRFTCLGLSIILLFFLPIIFRKTNNLVLSSKKYYSYFKTELRTFFSSLRRPTSGERLFVFIAFAIFFVVNIMNAVERPVSCDEAGTYLLFSSQNILVILSRYSTNNHPLNSLLIHVSDFLPLAPKIAIRLPSLIFGVFSFWLFFALAKTVFGSRLAFLALVLFAFSYPVMLYGFHGRGYGMLLFFSIGIIFCAVKISEEKKSKYWILFILFSVLGFYSVLSFLYVFITVGTALFLSSIIRKDGRAIKRLFLTGLLIAVSVITLYLPFFLISGIDAVLNNDFVKSKSLAEVLALLPKHIFSVGNFLVGSGTANQNSTLFSGLSGSIMLLIFLIYFVIRSGKIFSFSHLFLRILIPLGFVLVFLFIFTQRVIPYERTWIYLVCLTGIMVTAVFSDLVKKISDYKLLRLSGIIGAVVICMNIFNFNSKYKITWDADYKARGMYESLTALRPETKLMFTNEMIQSGLFEFYSTVSKEKKQIEYGYLDIYPFDQSRNYDLIIMDRSQDPIQFNRANYSLGYSNDYVRCFLRKPKEKY
jgi:hypothetical protein